MRNNSMKVKYPNGRADIISHMKEFADIEWQKNNWLKEYEEGKSYDFSMTMEIYFNDLSPYDLNEGISYIGYFFYDLDEAIKSYEFHDFMRDFFVYELNFRECYDHPKWPLAVEKARDFLDLLLKNNEKYGFQHDIDIYDEKSDEYYFNVYYTAEDERLAEARRQEAREKLLNK
jgi:hypothetical protein